MTEQKPMSKDQISRREWMKKVRDVAFGAPVAVGMGKIESILPQESDAKPIDPLLFDPEQFQDGDKIETTQMPPEMREHLLMPQHTFEHVIKLIEAAQKLGEDVSISMNLDFIHASENTQNGTFSGTILAEIGANGGQLNINDQAVALGVPIGEQQLTQGNFSFTSRQEAVDAIMAELNKRMAAGDQVPELPTVQGNFASPHSLTIEKTTPDGIRLSTTFYFRKALDQPGLAKIKRDGVRTSKTANGQLHVIEISGMRLNESQVAIQGVLIGNDQNFQTIKTGDLLGKMEEVQQS